MRTRIGVLGAGSWGINHIRAFANEPGCEVVAVAEPDTAKHALIRSITPCAIHPTADAVVTARNVDAVVIASPASTHVELALAALAADKHVLIEKPIARSVLDAARLSVAARASKRVVMAGHLMVFHPAVRQIRTLLRSGRLGKPYYLHATRVNLGRLRADETALWSFGPHDLSMIDFITGDYPETVSACGQSVLQPGIEDVVFMTLRYASGFIANLHLSWLHPRKERRLTLVCSQQMVEFDDQLREKLRIYDKGYDRPPEFTRFSQFLTLRDGDVHIPSLSMDEPLRLEVAHFVDCIQSGATPQTDITSAVRITNILDAAERSLRSAGTPLEIAKPADADSGIRALVI